MKPVKFLNSVQLFKFCQKVLSEQKGKKVHDQDIGSILNFNPSDCSHWKKGEKNVKSVFALEKLSQTLNVEISLVYDLACGLVGLEEAYFEFQEARFLEETLKKIQSHRSETLKTVYQKVTAYVDSLHRKANFKTAPLYLPEVLQLFPFINQQQIELMDKLSRVLRTKPGHYTIQYRKGELKPHTRMSLALDLGRILLEAERENLVQELGPAQEGLSGFERFVFASSLLCPQKTLGMELWRVDHRKDLISELATLFWVPKLLINFQIQNSLRFQSTQTTSTYGTSHSDRQLSF